MEEAQGPLAVLCWLVVFRPRPVAFPASGRGPPGDAHGVDLGDSPQAQRCRAPCPSNNYSRF